VARSRKLTQKLQRLPSGPGVYQYFDESGKLLYIGKAKSLTKRVHSYFTAKRGHSAWTARMVADIADLEYIETDSEAEAILLEAHLIREHQPRYNIRLRDDKSYLYLRITVNDELPTVTTTRKLGRDNARYFGPFSSQRQVKEVLRGVRMVFPFRTAMERPQKAFEQPIRDYLERHYGLDPQAAVQADLWRYIIREITDFLSGDYAAVVRKTEKAMKEAAKREDFETAAKLRDRISALERLGQEQKVASERATDEDIIGLAIESSHAMANIFNIRMGKIINRTTLLIDVAEEQSPGEIVDEFVRRFYAQAGEVPKSIYISRDPEDLPGLTQELNLLAGRKVSLTVPSRGDRKRLVGMAERNALESLKLQRITWLTEGAKEQQALKELQDELKLSAFPNRIECFDNSNLQGTNAVSSMVVFVGGVPNKQHYRRFRVKTVEGPDDFATMREVLDRRFGRALKASDQSDESFGARPDLVIIDGGKGQLTAAREILAEKGIEATVIGLAKRDEEIFLPNEQGFQRIYLPRHSAALYLIQRIRDEAHRFAVTYHQNLRSKQQRRSILDEIPGVGTVTKQKLMRHFGSLKAIKSASEKDIAKVVGKAQARRLTEHFAPR
jgi:excinuclease ABC subunit C